MKKGSYVSKTLDVVIRAQNDENPWEEAWDIYQRRGDKEKIGWVSVAGEKENGTIPISIEIPEKYYRNRGYGTQAIRAMVEWAFYHSYVYEIKTSTDRDNSEYIKALLKAGFVYRGYEGRIETYSITKPPANWSGIYFIIGIVLGMVLGIIFSNLWIGFGVGLFSCIIAGSVMDKDAKKRRREITKKDD